MYASTVDCDKIYKILTGSAGHDLDDTIIDICEKMLFSGIEDSGESGDVMIVFGSPDCLKYRCPKAFEAYFCKRAPKIIVSGANKIASTGVSEAQSMWEQLRGYGVENTNIYLEASAGYTHENVVFSADIIRSVFGDKPIKILAVTSQCHMRRVMLNFEHYKDNFADGTQVFQVPSADPCCESVIWQTTPGGRFRAATEIKALVNYIRKGYLPDFKF
ncbi:MAG: YdcF family protein [Clostridia bacterium]|nr:YdcF family protein [Clostridia bacterium]